MSDNIMVVISINPYLFTIGLILFSLNLGIIILTYLLSSNNKDTKVIPYLVYSILIINSFLGLVLLISGSL